MQAATQTIDRGTLVNLLHEDGRRATALLPSFGEGSVFAKSVANMTVAAEMFSGIVVNANSQFLPAARDKQLQSAVVNVLSKPFAALVSAGQDETQAINRARAVATAVDPATPVTAPVRARTMVRWDAATGPDKAVMVNTAGYENLAGLIESGALDEIHPDLRKIAKDRYMVLRHVAKTGLQANFQQQPTSNNPIAIGPDVEAATQAAQNALDGLNDRLAAVDDIARFLRNIVIIVSIAIGLPTERAYQLLVTGKVPA